MHIINLSIKCKTAVGDGTKVVCMNSDYKVRIQSEDCGTFLQSPVKKLIIRHGKEYAETDITEVVENGQTFLQAPLPPIEWADYIYLGVCGKPDDNPDTTPTYTSTPAKYACDNSVLNGVVILKKDPTLAPLDVATNGVYNAPDSGVDGFHSVNVHIPLPSEEHRTVRLFMADGDQVIDPSYATYLMSKVTLLKPDTLCSENIRSGVNIGGIIGSYEVKDYDGAVTIVDDEVYN